MKKGQKKLKLDGKTFEYLQDFTSNETYKELKKAYENGINIF